MSCEEISGTLIRRYPGEIPASPERSKAAALCNEAAELEVPRRPQWKVPVIFERLLRKINAHTYGAEFAY